MVTNCTIFVKFLQNKLPFSEKILILIERKLVSHKKRRKGVAYENALSHRA